MMNRSERQKVLAIIAQYRAATAEQLLDKIPNLTEDTLKSIINNLVRDKLIRPLKEDSWIISA